MSPTKIVAVVAEGATTVYEENGAGLLELAVLRAEVPARDALRYAVATSDFVAEVLTGEVVEEAPRALPPGYTGPEAPATVTPRAVRGARAGRRMARPARRRPERGELLSDVMLEFVRAYPDALTTAEVRVALDLLGHSTRSVGQTIYGQAGHGYLERRGDAYRLTDKGLAWRPHAQVLREEFDAALEART